MTLEDFRDALLGVMESKEDPAWSSFTSGKVPKEKLHIHFEQEFETYVRDFPVLIGWAYVQCPIAEVRQELVENMYEEETGRLSGARPHPLLFLEYPRGLQMDMRRFDNIKLGEQAASYRAFLDDATRHRGWEVAAAITTLFVEGTKYERGEVEDSAQKRPVLALEEHPLVVHYGLPLENLALTKAHRSIEGEHRGAAWRIILNHVDVSKRSSVVEGMRQALTHWLAYRKEVAAMCGVPV